MLPATYKVTVYDPSWDAEWRVGTYVVYKGEDRDAALRKWKEVKDDIEPHIDITFAGCEKSKLLREKKAEEEAFRADCIEDLRRYNILLFGRTAFIMNADDDGRAFLEARLGKGEAIQATEAFDKYNVSPFDETCYASNEISMYIDAESEKLFKEDKSDYGDIDCPIGELDYTENAWTEDYELPF